MDSLVDPLRLARVELGEIFVHRNIAGFVPPFVDEDFNIEKKKYNSTSAALEYGVEILQVSHVLIMGHGHCGGIKGLLNDTIKPGFRSALNFFFPQNLFLLEDIYIIG